MNRFKANQKLLFKAETVCLGEAIAKISPETTKETEQICRGVIKPAPAMIGCYLKAPGYLSL